MFVGGQVSERSFEVIMMHEFLRVNIVQQTPKFTGVVLYRSTRQQKYSLAWHSLQSRQNFSIFIFEPMSLVDNNELERHVHDHIIEVKQENFVTGDEYLEFVELRRDGRSFHGDVVVVPLIVLNASSSGLAILVIIQYAVHVGPVLHSPLPVLESGERSYHQEGSLDVFKGEQMVQESD